MRSETGAGGAMATGDELHALCRRLHPICRSITGDGVRATLDMLGELIPMQRFEVPSGTQVFDWTVPPEWNIRGAYLIGPDGERVVDFADCNLHVVNYSVPVRERLTLDQLQPRLHSIPEHPDWIPYRTSYYAPTWGFCLTHAQRQALRPGVYEAVIDSTLEPGNLTYGECLIRGRSEQEFVVSVHTCHPSLANDNLSGIAVATHLARELAQRDLRYSYRFIFVPSTIGAITWLARNRESLERVVGGLVISGVGDPGGFTYKRSRRGNSSVDRLFAQVLAERGEPHTIEPFSPYGYDERQFCSPGLDLPVGCLMRTPFGRYPQYHTSADDLELVRPASLAGALALCREVIARFDRVASYRNLQPFGEPQLGRRGLYDAIGGENDKKTAQMALLWMLSYSDGMHSTLDISEMSGLGLDVLDRAAARLAAAELLSPTQSVR